MKKNKKTSIKKAKKKFLVGIFYHTPTGRSRSKYYTIHETTVKKAQAKAKSKFRSEKGRGYPMALGNVIELKQS